MRVLLLTSLLAIATGAAAHGGGLDAKGCHVRRATGEYHCHRPQATATAPSGEKTQPAENDPTCYVGPRGGRYRIVNGRKRYGC